MAAWRGFVNWACGEQVATGWPARNCVVAGNEYIDDSAPRRADSFEKIYKVRVLTSAPTHLRRPGSSPHWETMNGRSGLLAPG